MAGIELDGAAAVIRMARPEAAEAAALAEQSQDLEDARRADKIRQQIEGGGTPTPEDLAFLKSKGSESTPPALGGEGGAGGGSGDKTAEEIAAIEAKITANEQLTAEEQAYVDSLSAEPLFADVSYKVGGKAYTFDEMTKLFTQDVGLDEEGVKAIAPEALKKMVDNFHLKMNKDEWNRSMGTRSQDIARSRKQLGDATIVLMNAQEGIKKDKSEAEALIVQLRAIAAKNVDPNDVYTPDGSRVDVIKQRELYKVLDAREELPKVEAKLQSLNERSVQTEMDLAAQLFRDFQENHPEYRTSRDILAVAAEAGKGTLSPDDEDKFEEMVEIFNTANALHTDAEKQHARWLRQGKVYFKPQAGSSTTTREDPARFQRDDESARKRLLANLQRKREHISLGGGKGGPGKTGKTKEQAGAEVIFASTRRYASGATDPEQNMNELNY